MAPLCIGMRMAILGQAEDAGQPGSMKLSSGGRRSKIFELEADICDALSSCRQRKFGNRIRFLRENRDHPSMGTPTVLIAVGAAPSSGKRKTAAPGAAASGRASPQRERAAAVHTYTEPCDT